MKKFITRAELQERLGVSPRGLDGIVARERLTVSRFGARCVRYDLAEVEALEARAARRAPAPPCGAAAAAHEAAIAPRRLRTA